MTANILGVNPAYKTLSCARSKCGQKVLPSKNGKFATCTSCKMLQNQNSCNLSWMAKLYVENERNQKQKMHLAAFNNIIKILIAINPSVDLKTCTEEELKFSVLDIDRLHISYDTVHKKIVYVQEVPKLDI